MEDKVLINNLLEKAESYGKTTVELIKLKTVDKVADGTSSLVAWFAVIVAVILFFTALNIGVALFIGDMLGKSWLGFFVVAGFYALIALILYLFRNKWIKRPVGETIINQLLN